jgi:hypothetical protein
MRRHETKKLRLKICRAPMHLLSNEPVLRSEVLATYDDPVRLSRMNQYDPTESGIEDFPEARRVHPDRPSGLQAEAKRCGSALGIRPTIRPKFA